MSAHLSIDNPAVHELVKITANELLPYADGVDNSSLTYLWSNLLCSYFPLHSSYLTYRRNNTDVRGWSYSVMNVRHYKQNLVSYTTV